VQGGTRFSCAIGCHQWTRHDHASICTAAIVTSKRKIREW
jgi:hypothetical protein